MKKKIKRVEGFFSLKLEYNRRDKSGKDRMLKAMGAENAKMFLEHGAHPILTTP